MTTQEAFNPEKFKALRFRKGVTQITAAVALGVAPPTYLRYEKGQTAMGIDFLNKALAYYGATLADVHDVVAVAD